MYLIRLIDRKIMNAHMIISFLNICVNHAIAANIAAPSAGPSAVFATRTS